MKAKLFYSLLVSVLCATYSIFDMATTPDIDFFSMIIDLFLIMFSILGLAFFAFGMEALNNKRNG